MSTRTQTNIIANIYGIDETGIELTARAKKLSQQIKQRAADVDAEAKFPSECGTRHKWLPRIVPPHCIRRQGSGAPMDFVLFSNYERHVELLLKGHIDIAWNTPLAHVRVKQQTDNCSLSLGMRDSDQDFHSRVVVRSDAGIASLKDLEGKALAVGSRDSPRARILPNHFLRAEGVDLAKVNLLKFDTDVGKHGDEAGIHVSLPLLACLSDSGGCRNNLLL